MTCSEYCKKKAGITLGQLGEITGRHRVTLDRWYNKDRQLFDVLLDGARYRMRGQQ